MAIDTQLISLTDDAALKLRGMIEAKANPSLALRVWVQPGGCSGFSYGMALDDSALADDVVSDVAGMRVFVDAFSAQHLQGAKIDYVDSLMGAGFTVLNPNATSSCGCGNSFASTQGGGDAHPAEAAARTDAAFGRLGSGQGPAEIEHLGGEAQAPFEALHQGVGDEHLEACHAQLGLVGMVDAVDDQGVDQPRVGLRHPQRVEGGRPPASSARSGP